MSRYFAKAWLVYPSQARASELCLLSMQVRNTPHLYPTNYNIWVRGRGDLISPMGTRLAYLDIAFSFQDQSILERGRISALGQAILIPLMSSVYSPSSESSCKCARDYLPAPYAHSIKALHNSQYLSGDHYGLKI
jgi:hypothetical protein